MAISALKKIGLFLRALVCVLPLFFLQCGLPTPIKIAATETVKACGSRTTATAGALTRAVDIKIADGFVYLVATNHVGATDSDWLIEQLTKSLARNWDVSHAGTGNEDRPTGSCTDSSNNLDVVGFLRNGGNATTNEDAADKKMSSSNGADIFTSTVDGPAGDSDRLNACAESSSVKVIAGYRTHSGPRKIAFIRALNPTTGATIATVAFDLAAGDTEAKATFVDSSNVLVVGIGDRTGQGKNAWLRISEIGIDLGACTVETNGPGNGDEVVVAVGTIGSLAIVAMSVVDGDGDLDAGILIVNKENCSVVTGPITVDTANLADEVVAMVIRGDNIYILVKATNSGGNVDFLIVKFNSAGTELWRTRIDVAGFDDTPSGLAVDSGGNVIATGITATSTENNIFTVKLSGSDGKEIWRVSEDPGDDDRGVAVAVDSNGNAYVAATRDQGSGAGRVMVFCYHSEKSPCPGQTGTAKLGLRKTSASCERENN